MSVESRRFARRLGEVVEAGVKHRLRLAGVSELQVDAIRQVYSAEFFEHSAILALEDEKLDLRSAGQVDE